MEDIFGQDVKLDAAGLAVVAANGELVLTDGAETGVQDIRLQLTTPLGELFYDIELGSLIHEFFLEEDSAAARSRFGAEVENRLGQDPRVELGTESCEVLAWDEKGFSAKASWQWIGEDHPYNLVVSWDNEKKELVADVNPRSGL